MSISVNWSQAVIGAASEVHEALEPGFREPVHEAVGGLVARPEAQVLT